MEIILIRHGKAEEMREGLEDLQRHLTDVGKEEIQKLAPRLKEKLEPLDKRTIIFWSSPAKRALQTAQLVADELHTPINFIHDFIYEGDFEKLSDEVQKLDEDTTVLLVGHQPNLSEWVEQMTGEKMKIEKGSMLNLKVTNRSPLEAKLQWEIVAE